MPGVAAAQSEGPVRIGVAAPLSGTSAILGEQVRAGAEAAARRLSQDGGAVETVAADTECTPDGGERAARSMVEAKVTAAVGFLCTEALETALPILREAGIPAIVVGVRANRITDKRAKSGALVWRIAPRSDAEASAIAAVLIARWRDLPFGIVEDGSIYGRGLADAVRSRLEAEGMKPSTLDNYRPAEEKQFGLARRLQKTGVTRFFIAGDRPDIAVIARDAAASGLTAEIVGGESLLDESSADTPLPEGIIAIGPQTEFPTLVEGGSAAPPQGYEGPAYAAVEIAVAAARQAAAGGKAIADVLNQTAFTTALGTIRFDAKGDSDLDLYRSFTWQGGRFVETAVQP